MPEYEKKYKKPAHKFVENLRKVAGTLPSEKPNKKTNILQLDGSIEVELVDHNANPYKAMFLTATATWGDNEFVNKWSLTLPENRFEVIKAVLTHNTLPQARECINFLFRVKGVPRWLFDYHTQVKFMTIMSIGCRDNNKLDADIIVSDEYLDNNKLGIFSKLKDLYEMTLKNNEASWQSARAFLPQSYSHSYYFGQNMLAISNAIQSFKEFYNSDEIETNKRYRKYVLLQLYSQRIVQSILYKFPLIGQYLFYIITNEKNYIFSQLTNMTYDELSDLDKKYFEEL